MNLRNTFGLVLAFAGFFPIFSQAAGGKAPIDIEFGVTNPHDGRHDGGRYDGGRYDGGRYDDDRGHGGRGSQDVCDLERSNDGYFYVSRNSSRLSGMYRNAESAVDKRNQLIRDRVCVLSRRVSRCRLEMSRDGYYFVSRDGSRLSGSYRNQQSATNMQRYYERENVCSRR